MSETLATAADNVRFLIRDRTKSAYAIPSHEMSRITMNAALELCSEAGIGRAWSSAFLSLSAGGYEASPTDSSIQYERIVDLKLVSQGYLLERLSPQELEERRGIASTTASGYPRAYCLLESTAQVLVFRFWPKAAAAEPIDALLDPLPTVGYTDATTLPFGEPFLRTIEKQAAIECLRKLPQEERDRLKVDGAVVEVWARNVARGVRAEQVRQAAQRRRPYGVGVMVWR